VEQGAGTLGRPPPREMRTVEGEKSGGKEVVVKKAKWNRKFEAGDVGQKATGMVPKGEINKGQKNVLKGEKKKKKETKKQLTNLGGGKG